jgi:hypothetical protein
MTESGQAGRAGRKRANEIGGGGFAPHRLDMLKSPAWSALSPYSLRIHSRLELEHLSHAGKENGNLLCTYQDFRKCGLCKATIAKGLRELEALGFLQIVRGFSGVANECEANRYRLTHLPAYGDRPSDEWRNIETLDEAKAIAKKARKTLSTRHHRPSYNPQRQRVAA